MPQYTLEERLQRVLSAATLPADPEELSDRFTEACQGVVADLAREGGRRVLIPIAQEEDVPTSGLPVAGRYVALVHKDGFDAAPIEAHQRHRIDLDGRLPALYQGRGYVYYQQAGRLYAAARGSAAAIAAKAFTVSLPRLRAGDRDVYLDRRLEDGDFSRSTPWTAGDGWTVGASSAACDGTQTAASSLAQACTLTEAAAYYVRYTVASRTAGTITAKVGAASGAARAAAGTYEEIIAAGAAQTFAMEADSDFAGTVDDVFVARADLRADDQFVPLIVWRAALEMKQLESVQVREAIPADTDLTLPALPELPDEPTYSYVPGIHSTIDTSTLTPSTITTTTLGSPGNPDEPTAPTKPTSATTIGAFPTEPTLAPVGPLDLPDEEGSPWALQLNANDDDLLQALLGYFDRLTGEFAQNVQEETAKFRAVFEPWVKQADRLVRQAEIQHQFDTQVFQSDTSRYSAQATFKLQDYERRLREAVEGARITLETRLAQLRATLEEQTALLASASDREREQARLETETSLRNAAESLRSSIEQYAARLRRHEQDLAGWRAEAEREQGNFLGRLQAATLRLTNLRRETEELAAQYLDRLRAYVRLRTHRTARTIPLYPV